jgi:NAD(P)-dependent dehydrogenase (short-subunit alcohol dehydrogenase family)
MHPQRAEKIERAVDVAMRRWQTSAAAAPEAPADASHDGGVMRAMARRQPLHVVDANVTLPMARRVVFKAGIIRPAFRLLVWLWAIIRFYSGNGLDRVLGRASIQRRAARLREIFEDTGASFAKLGQQLSLRAEVIATNLGSMFNATQPLVLQFVKQRAGSIINMTSFAGIHGAGAQTNYAASKAGIIGFTKALSKEVASFGVRVNAVAPGFIATDMLAMLDEERMKYIKAQIPAGRLGSCEDVAHLVCFLASDRASYITGQVIQVDGGLVL